MNDFTNNGKNNGSSTVINEVRAEDCWQLTKSICNASCIEILRKYGRKQKARVTPATLNNVWNGRKSSVKYLQKQSNYNLMRSKMATDETTRSRLLKWGSFAYGSQQGQKTGTNLMCVHAMCYGNTHHISHHHLLRNTVLLWACSEWSQSLSYSAECRDPTDMT